MMAMGFLDAFKKPPTKVTGTPFHAADGYDPVESIERLGTELLDLAEREGADVTEARAALSSSKGCTRDVSFDGGQSHYAKRNKKDGWSVHIDVDDDRRRFAFSTGDRNHVTHVVATRDMALDYLKANGKRIK